MTALAGVGVAYGPETVFRNLDLAFPEGSATVIIGRSGCGKSTLLRLLAGLQAADTGRVTVAGRPVAGVTPDAGLVFQNLGLFPWKTVVQNVDLGLHGQGLPPDERRRRVAGVLGDLGLTAVARKYPGQLSGGQAQRCAIARTLVRRPGLLLLDEPSAALDALTREDFQDLLLDLHTRHPATLVLVTHGIEEAAVVGDRTVVLRSAAPPLVLANPLPRGPERRSHPEFLGVCQAIRAALAGEA